MSMTASTPQSTNIVPPFLLVGRERAWRIVSGAVDVFLVDVNGETPHGPRRYVARLQAGGALFAVAMEDAGGAGLLACPLPGTRLDGAAAASVPSDALGKWTSALAQAIVSPPPDLTTLPDRPALPELGAFHRAALGALVRDRTEADRKERKRLTLAAGQEAAAAGVALRQLASPLGVGPAPAEGGAAMDLASPLLRASDAVGKAMGIRIRAPRGLQGAESVEAIARASGIRARRVALKGEWWREQSGPLLVFREEDDRPAAVLPDWRGRNRIWDPVEDSTRRLGRKQATSFGSFAWIFYRPFPPRKLGVWDLLVFGMRGAAADLTTILMMGIASGLLAVLLPVAMGITFDSIIPGADRSGLLAVSVFLGIAAVASALFELTRNFAEIGRASCRERV